MRDFAVADFNGDGKLDFAAAHLISKSDTGLWITRITIGIGADQKGSFTLMPDPMQFGGWVSRIVAGDFNGDGFKDVAFSFGSTDAGFTIMHGNGDGTFRLPESVSAGTGTTRAMAAGDLNGDGKDDIVASDFIAMAHEQSIRFTGYGFHDVSIADVNRDGHMDIVGVGSTPHVLIGNGQGTFTDLPPGDVSNPWRVAVGDLNQDDIPDLVITTSSSGIIFLFFGRGDGTFTSGPAYGSYHFAGEVEIVDINGDSKPEIMVWSPDMPGIYTHTNLGEGAFDYGGKVGAMKFPAQRVIAADFNADGLIDVIAGSRTKDLTTGAPGPDMITAFRNGMETALELCVAEAAVPSVTFCNVQHVATVPDRYKVLAAAKSDSGIYDTVLYVDDVQVAQASGSTLDTEIILSAGNHRLVAQAWDAAGRVFNSAVEVFVPQPVEPPPCASQTSVGVTICKPTDGHLNAGYISVVGWAQSSLPIVAMKVYIDDIERLHVDSDRVDKASKVFWVAPGKHSVVLQAWDSSGAVFKASRTVITPHECENTTIYPAIIWCGIKPGDTFADEMRFISMAYPAAAGISTSKLYVDDMEVQSVTGMTRPGVDKVLTLSAGRHRIVAQSWDGLGNLYRVTAKVNCLYEGAEVQCVIESAGTKAAVSEPIMWGGKYSSAVPVRALAFAEGEKVTHTKVYSRGVEMYQVDGDSVDITLNLASGLHTVVVQSWTNTGKVFNTARNIEVE